MSEPVPATPLRAVVLISGGGTTLVNLAQRIKTGELPIQIPLVIASRSGCGGIERSREAGIPCEIIRRPDYFTTADFSQAIFQRCRDVQAELVICGGFLSLLSLPADFQHRVMNIHPSLIPAFAGKGYHGELVHQAVLERGCRVSGCTVHFVDNEYDHGPIIAQGVVPVLDTDTAETLAARVFEEECKLYPQAISEFASGVLRVDGRRVHRVAKS